MKTAELRARLKEAEEALRAIRAGEVDAVVVTGKHGPQVFTLEGEEHAYRVLIESMNEGALTLTADKTILYANACFARMVKQPLERVIGGSFRHFLSEADRASLRRMLKRPRKAGFKIQVTLLAGNASRMPVNISIRPLEETGFQNTPASATLSMVVTDMTEARKSEERLRALTHRVLQVQEEERVRVARELHDTITQSLCGILVHSQVLVNGIPTREGKSKAGILNLSKMIGKTVDEVEQISRNLRPTVLNTLGLLAGLEAISTEFSHRAGISVKLDCAELYPRLPGDTEMALYRILQETLRNVEKHAKARHVEVILTKNADGVLLAVRDNGTGFDPERKPLAKGKARGGLGLLGMRERAASVGGHFKMKSTRDHGTEVEVRVPL